MKILVIGTSVFTLSPTSYAGLEALVWEWSVEFAKAGHSVSVVAPQGSTFPPALNIELIATNLGEGEDVSYGRYKDRLLRGEFDACLDSSWAWFSVLAQQEADKQLPVIHIYHSDYANLGSPPPIQYPCLVGLSIDHSEGIRRKWGVAVRTVYNGVPLDFYKPDPNVQRSNRYLWLGRYTPEKCPLEIIFLAKKCRIPLDMSGDVTIIANQDYANKCFQENDGRQIRVMPSVTREETVKMMQSHKALIHLVSYNEAFGLLPVEAQSTGLPVIVNRRGALPELVRHGKTGFVVDSFDEAEEIIKQDLVSKIKPEDCRKQATKFSIEKSAEGHLRCLQDIANGLYW
jgi:glycosyltransferase involved in cell wall biosynthesis